MLKRNPDWSPEEIHNHFDTIIAMALVDLLVEVPQAAVEINKSLLRLKCKLIPMYYETLSLVIPTEGILGDSNQINEKGKKSDHERQ